MRSPPSFSRSSRVSKPVRRVAVQHLLSPCFDLTAAQSALDEVGGQMGLRFELRTDEGEILLIDGAAKARLSPQMIHALREDRPLVTLPVPLSSSAPALPPTEHSRKLVKALLEQCRAIPILGERRQAGAKSDRALPRLLQLVLQGRAARSAPALWACFGPRACMQIDFSRSVVLCDPLALQHLRLDCTLPQQVSQATLQGDAIRRSLDETLWDLGIAAAAFPLHNAPANGWHAPITAVPGAASRGYSRSPLFLEALRLMQARPLSPAELRQRLNASEADLRPLLQACLLLGLADWIRLDPPAGAT